MDKSVSALGFLMLVIGINSLLAQVVTITDKSTAQPLEMVTISSQQPKAFTTTDARGQADISALKGAKKVFIRMLGFKTDTVSYAQLATHQGARQLKSIGLSLDQVVVSATRWNQSKREVPGRISTLSAKEVRFRNPQTAADMIGATGEVFIQKSQQGGGSPMIRGFATNRLLLVVDGVRMNTAIFRSGNVQNIINIDPFAVERSEVFFGPGSVIYGSDAIGGVMSFQTYEPTLSLTNKPIVNGNAAFRYASASTEVTGHFDINIGWKKWAFLSSATYTDYGDLKMGGRGSLEYLPPGIVERQGDSIDVVVPNGDSLLQNLTGYSQINVMQKIRFSPNKKWDIEYGFHYSTTSEYGRYDRYLQHRGGVPRFAEWNYGPQLWMMNNLQISNRTETTIYSQLNMRLAHQLFEESRISRGFQSNVRSIREEKVQAYSLNIDLKKNIGKRHQIFYGIEGIFNDVFSTARDKNINTTKLFEAASRYPRSNWGSMGAYLTYKYKPSEKISFQGGVRYNYFLLNAKFDTTFFPFPFTEAKVANGAVTGSLGMVYNPIEKLTASINLSTGFRAPNVDDMGKVFDSEPGAVVVPNPDLNAEYAYNAEVGAAKVFGNWLKVDATGYFTFLQNAMVRRNFTLNGLDSIVFDGELSRVQAIKNAASAYVYGVQAGIEIKLPKGFNIRSRFNFQKGQEELDDGSMGPLRHAGPWFGSTHFTFTHKQLKLDFYTDYNGEISNENLAAEEKRKAYLYASNASGAPYSPSWYTLNFKMMYQFDRHLNIAAGIENLTDQRYRTYSSGIAAPGLNFVISVRVSF